MSIRLSADCSTGVFSAPSRRAKLCEKFCVDASGQWVCLRRIRQGHGIDGASGARVNFAGSCHACCLFSPMLVSRSSAAGSFACVRFSKIAVARTEAGGIPFKQQRRANSVDGGIVLARRKISRWNAIERRQCKLTVSTLIQSRCPCMTRTGHSR